MMTILDMLDDWAKSNDLETLNNAIIMMPPINISLEDELIPNYWEEVMRPNRADLRNRILSNNFSNDGFILMAYLQYIVLITREEKKYFNIFADPFNKMLKSLASPIRFYCANKA